MSTQLMLAARRSSTIIRSWSQTIRAFSTPVETPKPTEAINGSTSIKHGTHKVDGLERKMLVWTGKYKNADEVPSYVSQDVMERTRNKIRIRLANIMMALTAVACIFMVWSGKKAAERGESVQKMNQDWHKEYNEKSIAEAQAAKASLKNK